MPATTVIAIFDLGRTHKKFMLFDEHYKVVQETAVALEDTVDEAGSPCEDLPAVRSWMLQVWRRALEDPRYDIRALNFSAHGASLVHLDAAGEPVTPLYDYMKALDPALTGSFYDLFGGRDAFSAGTGSPVLDMLNSGIQLYWLKKTNRPAFDRIRTSLHLPQYASYLFTQKRHADISSIGCHTGLWDFNTRAYHKWVQEEGVADLLPAPEALDVAEEVYFDDRKVTVGIGLHDSSAALLPFVYTANEPFLLLSSGTWNITLHPFFEGRLSAADYKRDCLYYLLDVNRPVAASRLFLGNEYQHQVKALEKFFHKQDGYHLAVRPEAALFGEAIRQQSPGTVFYPQTMGGTGPFPEMKGGKPDLKQFATFEAAYHKLMLDLACLQKISISLLSDKSPVKRLYVSGGFVQNEVFMELLAAFLPGWEIFIAENKRASALGAALALHRRWQKDPIPETVTPLLPYEPRIPVDVTGYRSYFEQG